MCQEETLERNEDAGFPTPISQRKTETKLTLWAGGPWNLAVGSSQSSAVSLWLVALSDLEQERSQEMNPEASITPGVIIAKVRTGTLTVKPQD